MQIWIILGVVGFVVLVVIGIYNRLVQLRNHVRNGFSQIDVQLKRRYDLIPNLVETAKGYLAHERETLEAVVSARKQAMAANDKVAGNPVQAGAVQSLNTAEQALTGSLGRLFALAESYPDLKANQTMAQLMEELTSTENKVSFSRQAYNDMVMSYNTTRETFPSVLLAGPFGFQAADLFGIQNVVERDAIKVSFK
ncbi:LemA family protein [Bdellovibrionota bacterium FG-1]